MFYSPGTLDQTSDNLRSLETRVECSLGPLPAYRKTVGRARRKDGHISSGFRPIKLDSEIRAGSPLFTTLLTRSDNESISVSGDTQV